MIKAVAQDGKLREMLMMPIKFLNGWLFGIDANRVNENAKESLIKYQRECFDVLASHFMPKPYGLKSPLSNAIFEIFAEQLPEFKAAMKRHRDLTPAQNHHIKLIMGGIIETQVAMTERLLWDFLDNKVREGRTSDAFHRLGNLSKKSYAAICRELKAAPLSDDEIEKKDFLMWLSRHHATDLLDFIERKPATPLLPSKKKIKSVYDLSFVKDLRADSDYSNIDWWSFAYTDNAVAQGKQFIEELRELAKVKPQSAIDAITYSLMKICGGSRDLGGMSGVKLAFCEGLAQAAVDQFKAAA